ncbi:unnamed protein product [Moneuplotes crassus]|uniref:Uncharacterized protein n=1 Tax=Euplotes crassus TaxID=5936 RepID=A0AAD2D179_EUPCR|nr:unnamed protein product [Moneuplotes crassus]
METNRRATVLTQKAILQTYSDFLNLMFLIWSNLMVLNDYSKDLPYPTEPAINFITSESSKGYPSDVSTGVAVGVPISPGAPQEETKNMQVASQQREISELKQMIKASEQRCWLS